MKSLYSFLPVCFILICTGILNAQTLNPKVIFMDDPLTHNMHLTSDGNYLYTCNGGKAELGQISKFTSDGIKIASYKINLDMRSIMFNASHNKFYVYTFNHKYYRINDLVQGLYSEVYDFSERNEQAVPALSTNGKFIYFMESGNVFKYKSRNRKLSSTISGLKTGDDPEGGGTAIAVDKNHIYCWDAVNQTVNIYDLDGKFTKSVQLNQGNYGFSLSFANGMLWVSADGDYDEGTWYGYEVK